METTTQASTAARGVGIMFMGNEILFMLQEARIAFLFIVILIITDFRLGRRESAVRYAKAQKANDTYTINKYRWRTSRAVRRSLNKLLDYVLVALLGLLCGAQFLEPLQVSSIWGTYIAAALIGFCELESIISHFLYLHNTGSITHNKITDFLKDFIIIFAKKKNADVGEALEKTIKENDN